MCSHRVHWRYCEDHEAKKCCRLMRKCGNFNSKYIPQVHPTKIPDGTTLNGVIYDCGGYNLFVYTGSVIALVG